MNYPSVFCAQASPHFLQLSRQDPSWLEPAVVMLPTPTLVFQNRRKREEKRSMLQLFALSTCHDPLRKHFVRMYSLSGS